MSIFSKIAQKAPKSSVFNLSHESKLSCNMGDLIPILCQEVLPSDSFKISTELLIKLAPLKAPMMHKVKAYVHYFFVPTYQINTVFQDFINPKVNSDNSIILPFCWPKNVFDYTDKNQNSLVGSLADYLGLPVTSSYMNTFNGTEGADTRAGKLLIDPFRVYQHIYNEYYRDQNLEFNSGDSLTDPLFPVEKFRDMSGSCMLSMTINEMKQLFKLRKRAWAKDYFTSALPSPQAGDDVLLPLNLTVDGDGPLYFKGLNETTYEPEGISSGMVSVVSEQGGNPLAVDNLDVGGNTLLGYDKGISVKNGTATINDLRRAMALQRFKELAERGGTRYSEMVRNFFGAFLKDYWVDRPIFLGGMSQNVTVSEVLQQSGTQDVLIDDESTTAFLGTRAGVGNAYGKTKTVSFKSPCHGYIMGILSLRPEAVYCQGVERMWCRHSLFDWAFPQFARMGEQEIWNSEIFAQNSSENDGVFGYTPRYAEYKHGHSHIAGEFRRSLDYWTMTRKFTELPTLSKDFVQMDKVNYEPFAVTSDNVEHCYVDLYNKVIARRPLPYFGTPSVI